MSLSTQKYMHIIASNRGNGCHDSRNGDCAECKCKCFLQHSYSPIEYLLMAIVRSPKRHEKMCVCGHSYASHFCHDHHDEYDEYDNFDSYSDNDSESDRID